MESEEKKVINIADMHKRLDVFSKIILATGQLNYFAASLDSLNEQLGFVCANGGNPTLSEAYKENLEQLNDTYYRLKAALKKLMDYMQARDAICEIDHRVAQTAAEILFLGKDEIHNIYDEQEL